MKLKLKYSDESSIPDGYAALYTEKDGEWVLTGVDGMKTSADTGKLSDSLRKEREDHKKTKDKLAKLGEDPDMDDIVNKLDDYDDMKARIEAGEGGKIDDAKVEEMVEARVARQVKPIERERDQLKSANEELATENASLKGEISTTSIEGTLRKLATEEKVVDTALDDVLDRANIFEIDPDSGDVVTRSGVRGVEPGILATDWMTDMKEKRPHWWPASEGGGAGGGKGGGAGGNNPWSASNWDLDAQGTLVMQDRAKAERYAKAAGSHIGATKPADAA